MQIATWIVFSGKVFLSERNRSVFELAWSYSEMVRD